MNSFPVRIDSASRRIEIDGHNVANQVTGVEVVAQAREVPRVTLYLLVTDTDLTFEEAVVDIEPHARDLLIRLGWIPPAELETALGDEARTGER